MKINFDNLPLKTNADNKTAYGITKTEQGAGRTQALRSGKMLTDISGIVMENAALKGQGMTADESAGDLLQTMVGLQKNYMSVMSDSMSGDDISRMMDEGFSPAEVDFEEAVTIVDKIKAELVKGGNYVPGYTDDVDLEALQEVAGSEASARQMQKALEENDVPVTKENLEDMSKAMVLFQGLKTPSEEAVSYLLRNDMEPTIEALHKAEFSGQKSGAAGNGYFAQAGVTVESAYYSHAEAQVDVEALAGSIEKVLTQAGFEATPQMLERAKAMIQEGIPLTGENLEKAEDIRSIDLKESSKDLFDQMAKAMASGKKAQETSLVAENS
ncbi:MAG: DUF6240 domain-containing protein, partial [Lachnospiraceae bacterium]|nr:DUF6240 domain-containing protein [Lachnospiraceae bacterium]